MHGKLKTQSHVIYIRSGARAFPTCVTIPTLEQIPQHAAESRQIFQPSLSNSRLSPSTNLKSSAVSSFMFDIAKIPRELRDMIYEAALVRDVILVAPTEVPRYENVSRSTWQDIRDPPIAGPRVYRTGAHEETVTNSYYLQASNNDAPNLNLFHTSRQIYTECWSIFYKHNMFDFSSSGTTVTAASMCLAFLNDRPQRALQLIRRIHLSFGEPLHHQDSRLIPSPLSPQWGSLCTILSRNLSLHQLILSVDGRFSNICPVIPGNGGVQSWVQEICKITNLSKLDVDVTSKLEFEGAFNLIDYLRARMLTNGLDLEKLGCNEFLYTKKMVGSRPWMVVSNYVLPKKYSADGVLIQCPSGRTAILMVQLENLTERIVESEVERERLTQL